MSQVYVVVGCPVTILDPLQGEVAEPLRGDDPRGGRIEGGSVVLFAFAVAAPCGEVAQRKEIGSAARISSLTVEKLDGEIVLLYKIAQSLQMRDAQVCFHRTGIITQLHPVGLRSQDGNCSNIPGLQRECF